MTLPAKAQEESLSISEQNSMKSFLTVQKLSKEADDIK